MNPSFLCFLLFYEEVLCFYVKQGCLLCSSPTGDCLRFRAWTRSNKSYAKKPGTGDAVLSSPSLNKTHGCVTFLFVLLTRHEATCEAANPNVKTGRQCEGNMGEAWHPLFTFCCSDVSAEQGGLVDQRGPYRRVLFTYLVELLSDTTTS